MSALALTSTVSAKASDAPEASTIRASGAMCVVDKSDLSFARTKAWDVPARPRPRKSKRPRRSVRIAHALARPECGPELQVKERSSLARVRERALDR